MKYMLITEVPEVASYLVKNGLDRIFMDRESLGKFDRQKNMNTPIYTHSLDQIKEMRREISNAELMLRINPVNENTKNEIKEAINLGVDVIMLPYFKYPEEVQYFIDHVDGLAKTNILFETAAAAARAEQILSIDGIDEVHFGLNDLKISLGIDFLFESVAGGFLDHLCSIARKNNLDYGIGGIGRVGKELLPAELVLKEYIRLGSKRTIMSRVFHNESKSLKELLTYIDFPNELNKLRNVESEAILRSRNEIDSDRAFFIEKTNEVTKKIKEKAKHV